MMLNACGRQSLCVPTHRRTFRQVVEWRLEHKMEKTMIDTILTLPLELMALTVLVGFGILYSYGTRRSVPADAQAVRPYDMRRDGQRFGLTPQPG